MKKNNHKLSKRHNEAYQLLHGEGRQCPIRRGTSDSGSQGSHWRWTVWRYPCALWPCGEVMEVMSITQFWGYQVAPPEVHFVYFTDISLGSMADMSIVGVFVCRYIELVNEGCKLPCERVHWWYHIGRGIYIYR